MRLYGLCPKKARARDATIVKAWRNLTGQVTLGDRQLWTLPGQMYDDDGNLQPGCELNHMLRAGLIACPSQLCGVERVLDIHEGNLRAMRHLTPGPRLFHGEFHLVLEGALGRKDFRPAVINLDTLYEPRKAARLLGQSLNVLNRVVGVKMVVLNAIVDAPRRGRRYTLNSLVDAIGDDLFCRHQLQYGWKQSIEGWVYNGTGKKQNTKMGSLIFFQPYKEAAIAV